MPKLQVLFYERKVVIMLLVTFLPLIFLVVAAGIFLLTLWIARTHIRPSDSDKSLDMRLIIQRQQELMEENEQLKERVIALEDTVRQLQRNQS